MTQISCRTAQLAHFQTLPKKHHGAKGCPYGHPFAAIAATGCPYGHPFALPFSKGCTLSHAPSTPTRVGNSLVFVARDGPKSNFGLVWAVSKVKLRSGLVSLEGAHNAPFSILGFYLQAVPYG